MINICIEFAECYVQMAECDCRQLTLHAVPLGAVTGIVSKTATSGYLKLLWAGCASNNMGYPRLVCTFTHV
jgi:hypothetical protein